MKRYLLVVIPFFLVGWSVPASADCLVRTFKDASGLDRPMTVVVPAGEVKDYAGRGFQVTSCGAVDLVAYRNEVCKLATVGNSAVQKRLEAVLGVSPARMCASAKAAAMGSVPITRNTDAVSAPADDACTGDVCGK